MDINTEPRLDAPGAGLPFIELFIGRRLFALKQLFGSRESFSAQFLRERDAIHRLVAACEASRRSERVLIPRLRGLEDSSRYWSVWMTLDHLRITNHIFAAVITSLAQGNAPKKKASTATVKPDPAVTSAVEAAFDESCEHVLAAVAAVPDLRTTARYAHPWFGPLDAAGWHALAGGHMRIHRAQITTILAALPSLES